MCLEGVVEAWAEGCGVCVTGEKGGWWKEVQEGDRGV